MVQVLLFSLYTIIRLVWDTIRIKRSKAGITRNGYNMRDLMAVPSILLIALISHLLWPAPPYWTSIVAQLGIMVFLFDYLLNLTTGKHIAYISLDSKSIWERARLATKTPYAEFMIKLFLLVCGLACYFYWELL